MKFATLKMRTRFSLLLGFFLFGFAAYGWWSFKTLDDLKVNGPLYQRIIQSKDLVADILPPPEYIIESYLVSLQLTTGATPSEQKILIDRLKKLKAEYDFRHEFWLKESLEQPLRDIFLKETYDPAVVFYDLVFNELIPSVRKDDREAIAAIIGKINREYEKHRKAIDRVVEMSNRRVIADENFARTSIQSATWLLMAILLISVVISVGVAGMIVRSIVNPMRTALGIAQVLTEGASEKIAAVRAIANGNLEHDVIETSIPTIAPDAMSRDEVGELLRSIVQMGEVQQSLDKALSSMTNSLRANRVAEHARDWVKSGQNDLGALMRGEYETKEMADRVLTYLVERLGAGIGVLYLREEDSKDLRLAASYALPKDIARKTVDFDAGLIGQAVRERKTILLAEVPQDFFPIQSVTGTALPTSVVTMPLLHAETLVGAIEIGAFKSFSAVDKQFLESVSESLAIGFTVNLSQRKTRNLLQQTQEQAAELQVQQEELQQSNAELEERAELLEKQREEIRAKNEELEAASQEIERKAVEFEKANTYKSDFLANMSHELRTPLNSMLILSGILKNNKEGNLSSKQVEYAATINTAGHDLLNLINDILDLSKIEAGRIELQMENTLVEEIYKPVTSLFIPIAEDKGVKFFVDVKPDTPSTIYTDLARTQQVLKNLISNAMKFTSEGEVSLTIRRSDEDNPLKLSPVLAFAVSDTGIGIPEDKQAYIFDVFRQADSGINRKYGGTGLGLSISRHLAECMGGKLLMHSVVGKGSVFTLYLPFINTHSALATTTGESTSSASGEEKATATAARKLLIVEGSVKELGSLAALFSDQDAAIFTARSGTQAIDLLRKEQCSCIVLDFVLPDMTSSDFLKRMKQIELTHNTPVIIYSEQDLKQEEERELRHYAKGIVIKGSMSQERLFNEVMLLLRQVEENYRSNKQCPTTLDTGAKLEGKNILLVDDDIRNIFSLSAILLEKKVNIIEAANGNEAIVQLQNHPEIDIVLMDIMMPEKDGFTTIREIRGMRQYERLPIIAMTAKAMKGDQEKCFDAGASDYITKPIDVEKLMSLLQVWSARQM